MKLVRTVVVIASAIAACASAACLTTIDASKLGASVTAASDANADGATPARPSASTTGVPAGTTLTPVSTDVVVTVDDTVIDAQDIAGCVVIRANRVAVRRSKITCKNAYAVLIDFGAQQASLEDDEIIGGSSAGIGPGNFSGQRLNVHDFSSVGVQLASSTLNDSWVHDPLVTGHAVVECVGGTSVSLTNDFLDGRTGDGGSGARAARISDDVAPTSNVSVTDSDLFGGPPTVEVTDDDGGLAASTIRFQGNRIGRVPTSDAHVLAPGVVWLDNVWADTMETLP